ncbi:hypothetical protein HK096_008366, partial [Nowakowskiella sp. JEL0078]
MKLFVLVALYAGVTNAALQLVSNWGTNPSNLELYVNVPSNKPTNPAVVFGLHGCGGTGPQFGNGEWENLSNQYGFIGIFPSATAGSKCWDVSSAEGLRRNNVGSDALGLYNILQWAKSTYKIDERRVFVTGFSSGAMMTNVMAAVFPDLIAGAAPQAGVPYFCFGNTGGRSASDISNSGSAQCPKGNVIKSAAEWGSLVHNAYPGYTGSYPPMMIWHGTQDTLLVPAVFQEEIKEWTNIQGVSINPTSNDILASNSLWKRQMFGSPNSNGRYPVEAVAVQGAGHGGFGSTGQQILNFWNLDGSVPSPSPSPSTSRTSPSPSPSTTRTSASSSLTTTGPATSPSSGTVPAFGQCGGQLYSGPTTCVSGYTCVPNGIWYSQCHPSSSASSGVSSSASHSSSPSPPPATGGTVPAYGQCGGQAYTGSTTCVSGYTCVENSA